MPKNPDDMNRTSKIQASVQHSGQATIEYLIVLPVLLLLFLASLQFVFIYEAKLTLNYATFSATRAGALNNGSMSAIEDGLASGLAPLFNHGDSLQALKDARTLADTETSDNKLTKIQIINPNPAALSDFNTTGEGIPNDNLMYRDDAAGSSGMDVQDANLLKVRVTYCTRLIVPVIKEMIYGIVVAHSQIISSSGGPLMSTLKVNTPAAATGLCARDAQHTDYRIPLSADAVVRMQSPFKDPGKWTGP